MSTSLRRARPLALSCAALLIVGGLWFLGRPTEPDGPSSRATSDSLDAAIDVEPGDAVRAIARVDSATTRGASAYGYHAPIGREMRFSMTMSARTALSSNEKPTETRFEADSPTLEMRLTSEMRVHVVGRDGRRMMLQVALENAKLVGAGPVAPTDDSPLVATAHELGLVADVIMMDDGSVIGLRVDPAVGAEARGWLRSVLCAFHFIVPDDLRTDRWEREEADTTGVAMVAYRWEDEKRERIVRERLRYIASPETPELADTTLSGSATGHLDSTLGWLRSAAVDEVTQIAVGPVGGVIRYTAHAALEFLDVADDVTPRNAVAPWDGDGWSPLLDAADAETLALAMQREERQDALRGQTLQSLLDAAIAAIETHGMQSREAYDATTLLTWLLQENPEQAWALDAILRSGALPQGVQMFALGALGVEATPEAQRVLAGIATDPVLPDGMRVSALHSVFQIAAPDAALVQSVAALLDSGAPKEVEGTALLLFGHMAGIGGDAGTPANVGDLLAFEARASALGLTDVWLDAIGNSGAAEAVPRVDHYLMNSQDAVVRTTAVRALRDIQSPSTNEILERTALSDSAQSVRAAAANLLAKRANGSASVAASVRQLLENETDAYVRRNALTGLLAGSNGWSPTVKTALQWSATYDVDAELRALAKGMLKSAGA